MDSSRVIDYFYQLSKHPRNSGHEEQARNFLVSWAEEKQLQYTIDRVGNIIVHVEGKGTKKDSEILAFQSHIDMVCVKEKGSDHNFETDGIEVIEKDGYLTAKDTTLGADNGIGVALMMELVNLSDHPPMELIFTIDEEQGLVGAQEFDTSILQAKKMINLDWETTPNLCIGTAGGARVHAVLPLKRSPSKYTHFYTISISGLKGGHSGDSIHKPVGNALLLAATFALYNREDLDVIHFSGGKVFNAICSESQLIVATDSEEKITDALQNFCDEYKKHFDAPDLHFEINPRKEESRKIENFEVTLEVLLSLGSGVVTYYDDKDPSHVQTSFNLGVIEMQEDEMTIKYLARSSDEGELDVLLGKFEHIYGKNVIQTTERYPSWNQDPNDPFVQKAYESMKKTSSEEIIFVKVHAGTELSIFASKMPDLAAISIGPTIDDPHTPQEKVGIKDIEQACQYLDQITKDY